MKMTAQEYAEKLVRRAKASVPDYQRGIERTTKNPGVEAAKRIDKMQNNFNEAIASGRTKRALESVSLEDWKTKAKTVGSQRIAAGLDAAQSRIVEVGQNLIAANEAIQSKLASMPKNTLQDSVTRMVTQVTEMAKLKGKI